MPVDLGDFESAKTDTAQPDLGDFAGARVSGATAAPDLGDFAQAKVTISPTPETDKALTDFSPKAIAAARARLGNVPREAMQVDIQDIKAADVPILPKQALPPYWYAKGLEAAFPQSPTAQRVGAGLEGVAELGSEQTTAGNVLMAPFLPEGKAIQRGIGLVFLGQQLIADPQQYKEFLEAKTPEEKIRIATRMIGGHALPTLIMAHSLVPAKDVAATARPSEPPATVTPPEAQTRPVQPLQTQERPSGESPEAGKARFFAAGERLKQVGGNPIAVVEELANQIGTNPTWSQMADAVEYELGGEQYAQQISSPSEANGRLRSRSELPVVPTEEGSTGVQPSGQGEGVAQQAPQTDQITHAIRRIVTQANTHPRELRIAIDNKTGEVLAENVGTQLPKEWNKPSEEAGWGVNDETWRKVGGAESITDMHSHPEPIGPSDGDWGVFGFSNVRKMIVAEKGGKLWTMEKTPEWDAMPWQQRTPRELRDAYNAFIDAIQGEELTSRTTEEHIAHVNRQMADKFGVKLTESVTQPEGGGEPATAAAPPPAAEPPVGGVSERAFERIYGEGEIPGGEGKGPEEMFQDAKARQAAGKADPYAVVQRARTGAITPEEFSDLVAEHDRLVTEAAAKEGTPEYEPAYQAARDFATNVIGPAKTRVSDTMRAMQIKAPVDYTRLTGFRQALAERMGREMTPEEAPAFQKVANDVAKANGEAQAAARQTATRVQRHFSRVKDISFEDAVRQLQEDIGKALGPCEL